MLSRRHVFDLPAGDRSRRTRDAEDEPVVVRSRDRAFQVELGPPLLARLDRVALEEDRAAADLNSARVKQELGAMPQSSRRGCKHPRAGIDPPGRLERAWPGEHVTPLDLTLLDPDEIDRDAISRHCGVDLLVVLLQPTHAGGRTAGHDLKLITDGDRAIDQCAGGYGAEAAHREDAIDRDPRTPEVNLGLDHVEGSVEARDQLAQPLAADC